MRITQWRISNYKSITDSASLDLGRITVFAGKNNTGKTACIEGLHRLCQGTPLAPNVATGNSSGNTNGFWQHTKEAPVRAELTWELEPEERENIFAGFTQNLWGRYVFFSIECWWGYTRILSIKVSDEDGKWDQYTWSNGFNHSSSRNGAVPSQTIQEIFRIIWDRLRSCVVYIGGTREPLLNQTPEEHPRLDSRASNLHRVFHTLLSNDRDSFDRIEQVFKLIFPDVGHIHSGLRQNTTHIEIEFEGLREKIRLEDCGTGYTHVLMLLCIAFSDQRPIVLFDEPNSYLHPSAEKAIYQLAAQDPRHQYIFTTHSAVLINYPTLKTIHLVSKEYGNSRFTMLDSVREALDDIGIRNSDFALSDRVLFVEGPTEENVIPLVLRQYGIDKVGYNYTIVNLNGTGSEFKDIKLMSRNARTYEKLFQSIAATPVPYRILIDADERNVAELFKSYNDKLIVLPRREVENYFLVPEAVAAVLNSLEIEANVSDIQKYIADCLENTDDRKLYPKGSVENPIKEVVGSEVLERLFSSHHAVYSKPTHGRQIVEWLLNNSIGDLEEIADILKSFIQDIVEKVT